jgi:hypothetical protein
MSRIRLFVTMLSVAALTAAPDLKAQAIGAGTVVTAKATAPVYTSPPGGAFYRKGDLIDSVRTDERLRVRETKEVATLGKRHLYLKVELPASRGRNPDPEKRIGWVYFGPVGGDSNFQIAPGEQPRSH